MTTQTQQRKSFTFLLVWLGQAVSLIGSNLTNFALGVWVFQESGSITRFALIGLFAVLPRLFLSPLAGVLVDRWERRKVMLLSDFGAGVSTLVVVLLFNSGSLEIWHIYLAVLFSASFGTIQWPAYTAAITHLVDKEKLGRANGLTQLGQASAEILAPALAGALLPVIGLSGVILIDLTTFIFAVLTLLVVRFPEPTPFKTAIPNTPTLFEELAFGWHYIIARQGILGMLLFLAIVNFLWSMVGALITPMILGFTTSEMLGMIISIAGLGMLSGSLAMSAWGGPRRRIDGVLGFELLSGVCFIIMGARPSFWLIALGAFGAHLTIAIVYGSNQAIWQQKVDPSAQGRVFAIQQMFTRAIAPLAYLIAGPVAERIFEPLMDGATAGTLGNIIGTGPGRGIGLLFLWMGLIKISAAVIAYAQPNIRRIEEILPDAV